MDSHWFGIIFSLLLLGLSYIHSQFIHVQPGLFTLASWLGLGGRWLGLFLLLFEDFLDLIMLRLLLMVMRSLWS